MEESAQAVIDWSRAHGRTPYYMKLHEPLTDPAVVAHRGRFHVLILANETSYPDYLRPIAQGSQIPD